MSHATKYYYICNVSAGSIPSLWDNTLWRHHDGIWSYYYNSNWRIYSFLGGRIASRDNFKYKRISNAEAMLMML